MPKGTAHKPTDETREIVRKWTLAGIKQQIIAEHIGIEERALRNNYRAEIDESSRDMLAKVARSLYAEAMAGNVSAAIFVMKCRGGWREADPTDDDIIGEPVRIVINPPQVPRSE